MAETRNDVSIISIVFVGVAATFLGIETQSVFYAGALSFGLLSIILMLLQISRK